MLALSHGEWTEFMCINTDLSKHSTQQPRSPSHSHTHTHSHTGIMIARLLAHWTSWPCVLVWLMGLFQRRRPGFLTTASERGTRWCSTAGRSWERSVRQKQARSLLGLFSMHFLPVKCVNIVFTRLCVVAKFSAHQMFHHQWSRLFSHLTFQTSSIFLWLQFDKQADVAECYRWLSVPDSQGHTTPTVIRWCSEGSIHCLR